MGTLVFSTGAKGGVGKSTLAILMIEALKEAGVEVSAIEGDPHSPTLVQKYGESSLNVEQVDLSELTDLEGLEVFLETIDRLKDDWVVINTPATGVRLFDEEPALLSKVARNKRATWSLSIRADRNDSDGAEDDGLFASMNARLLSALHSEDITVVRPLFQRTLSGQKFWFDRQEKLAWNMGLDRGIEIRKIHSMLVDQILRGKSSMSEFIATSTRGDSSFGASLEIFWYEVKVALGSTVLSGAPLKLGERVTPMSVRRGSPRPDSLKQLPVVGKPNESQEARRVARPGNVETQPPASGKQD